MAKVTSCFILKKIVSNMPWVTYLCIGRWKYENYVRSTNHAKVHVAVARVLEPELGYLAAGAGAAYFDPAPVSAPVYSVAYKPAIITTTIIIIIYYYYYY